MHIRRTATTHSHHNNALITTIRAMRFFRDYEELRTIAMTDTNAAACVLSNCLRLALFFGEVSLVIFHHFLNEHGLRAVVFRL